MSPTTCPRCHRPMDAPPGATINYCPECGTPITPDEVRERIVDLMLKGIRDDMREADVRADEFQPPESPADGVNSSNACEHLRV